jgi:hypothetical protein
MVSSATFPQAIKHKHSAREARLAGQKGASEQLMTAKGGNNDQYTKCGLIREYNFKL